jgi:hypothetical protein
MEDTMGKEENMSRERFEFVVTDIRIPFWSLVWIMVKFVFACIPVAALVALIWIGVVAGVGSLSAVIVAIKSHPLAIMVVAGTVIAVILLKNYLYPAREE